MTERLEKYTNEEKIRAAYALNMCTVSVSQIVDYHDAYILEQEYDAIFNNLNLENMPKDEALLRILVEMLNTITFFKIQEIKRKQIEEKYEKKVRNAIWSAVPNISMFVSGSPVTIALSIAAQVGTAYLNYRKEKANAESERNDKEIELQITAIEQFNALKRELFTTAWRLADEYGFDDSLRLTEKQIAQYNQILMDKDEYRKYARMESIADKFEAYPPFWYFFGHSACYIATNPESDMNTKAQYYEKAINHFEKYYNLCKNNLLREDQLTASFALEYIDLLCGENNKGLSINQAKIYELASLSEKMSPTSFDILQLCSITYLKIGKTDDAMRLLKKLVFEDYNSATNAKLLSRLYVSNLITNPEKEPQLMAEYNFLLHKHDANILFPLPTKEQLKDKNSYVLVSTFYFVQQRDALKKEYQYAIQKYFSRKIIEFNRILPHDDTRQEDAYFKYNAGEERIKDVEGILSSTQRDEFRDRWSNFPYRIAYVEFLNSFVEELDTLSAFRDDIGERNYCLLILRNQCQNVRDVMDSVCKESAAKKFGISEYRKTQEELSLYAIAGDFINKVKETIALLMDTCLKEDQTGVMGLMEKWDTELQEFCIRNQITLEDSIEATTSGNHRSLLIPYTVFGKETQPEIAQRELNEKMHAVLQEFINKHKSLDSSRIRILLKGTAEFEDYFCNSKFEDDLHGTKRDVVAVIDDREKTNYDLLLTKFLLIGIKNDKLKCWVSYNDIEIDQSNNTSKLVSSKKTDKFEYTNPLIDMRELRDLLRSIAQIVDEAYEEEL